MVEGFAEVGSLVVAEGLVGVGFFVELTVLAVLFGGLVVGVIGTFVVLLVCVTGGFAVVAVGGDVGTITVRDGEPRTCRLFHHGV